MEQAIILQNKKVARIGLTYHSKVPTTDQPKVTDSNLAYQVLLENWNQETIELQESFIILLLTTAKRAHGLMVISTGGMAATYVDAKLIFAAALSTRAHGIILAHNHPSGNLKPSNHDRLLTQKLVEAGKILDIPIFDHLIITKSGYFSFADEGIL